MKKNGAVFVLLFLIVFLAGFLRFFRLGEVPPSLSWDETALGYNAYSIGLTGKDEYGSRLPVSYFASFGDYKPPVYIYLAVLPIKIFGLNEFAVRFPSAFLGTLTVLLTYFLVRELFPDFPPPRRPKSPVGEKPRWGLAPFRGTSSLYGSPFDFAQDHLRGVSRQFSNLVSQYPSILISLLSSFLLAISPWHIIISRQAFEANAATFLIVLGIFLFLRSLRSKSWLIFVSAICFALSFYAFNSARVFVPLLLFAWGVFFRKELWVKRKFVVGGLILMILLLLPLIPHLISPQGRLRFKEVNIFSDLNIIVEANRRIEVDQNVWWARLIHNRRLGYLRSFLLHYFDHFKADFLFFEGDINPKFSARDTGQLYLIESLFLVAGFCFLAKNGGKSAWTIFSWLLIGLVPAATARETPHALRTLITLPVWQIIIALGIVEVVRRLKTRKARVVFYSLLSTLYFFSVSYFLHNLFFHWPFEFSQDWQYGYKEAANYALRHEGEYDEIWVSGVYGRPYIFFLFHQKRHPSYFWKEGKIRVDEFGFYHTEEIGKYKFGFFDLNRALGKKVLLIGAPKEIPENTKTLFEVKFLNGETAFVAGEI